MQRLASLLFIGGSIILMSFTNPATSHKGEKPAKSTTVPAKATTFQVDKQQSKLTWTGKKLAGQHAGTINIADGKLDVENNVLKSGTFSLDTRTIAVTDIKDADGNAKLIGHLKNDDFFAVEKFPTATFVTTGVTAKGNGNYEVTGNLTLKGITNPISFPATVTVAGNKLTAKAAIKVDRTKFNIRYGSKNFFEGIGDKAIYDEFDLDVVLVATAK
ncbi:YceI family protein [Chitinophaga nivalis]|uniref:YceI family protein n=1 Tax=Chitinophaga nivalis TaxID=2991709 RepID=A0ABT3IM69_9BACT|nr:YceI family protein [Chitinophaga nivalis]MCW3465260.1 YceI family protein [Chitinophaga nivalis]MCW3485048.1 YceI family protein [Chitinophaga nivalis]